MVPPLSLIGSRFARQCGQQVSSKDSYHTSSRSLVFRTTQTARDWIDSGDDINLLRILHTTLGFVGLILKAAQQPEGVKTTDLYDLRDPYRVEGATVRLLITLLEEVGAIEEVRYLIKRTTPLGNALLETLPEHIAESENEMSAEQDTAQTAEPVKPYYLALIDSLVVASKDPYYNDEPSGEGFERVISEAFRFLGAHAQHIGGSGNTDVLVSLTEGNEFQRYVVDAKSKSSGIVDAGDLKETNLEEHRNMHDAAGIAIVGHDFSGGHIRSWASRKPASLISVERLGGAIAAHNEVGLSESDVGLFLAGRFDDFDQSVDKKRRNLQLISLVISALIQACDSDEDDETDRSPRDIWLEEKRGEIRPSQDELCEIVQLLAGPGIEAIEVALPNDDKSKTSYRLQRNPMTTARMLRALARFIEQGVNKRSN